LNLTYQNEKERALNWVMTSQMRIIWILVVNGKQLLRERSKWLNWVAGKKMGMSLSRLLIWFKGLGVDLGGLGVGIPSFLSPLSEAKASCMVDYARYEIYFVHLRVKKKYV